MSSSEYVAPEYEAPAFFAWVGTMFNDVARNSNSNSNDPNSITNNNNLLVFVQGTRTQQVTVAKHMVGLGVFFVVLSGLWFLTLGLLKCQGRARMGCAAGYGFHDDESDDPVLQQERRDKRKERRGENALFQGGDDVSVGARGGGDSVQEEEQQEQYCNHKNNKNSKNSKNKKNNSTRWNQWFGGSKQQPQPQQRRTPSSSSTERQPTNTAASNIVFDEEGFEGFDLHLEPDCPFRPGDSTVAHKESLYSIPKINKTSSSSSNGCDFGCCSDEPHRVQTRKLRTRIVYIITCVVSLTCSALLFTEMYYPLEDSAITTSQVVKDTQQVVTELNDVLRVMRQTAVLTQTILAGTDSSTDTTTSTEIKDDIQPIPLDYQSLCPSFPQDQFAQTFGFQPQAVIDTVSKEYAGHMSSAWDALTTAQNVMDYFNNVLADVDVALQTTNDYLWVLPLLIFFSMLVTFCFGGLLLAVSYKERTVVELKTDPPKIENWFGWTVLPIQIIVVLVAWILVICFCFGLIVTTDTCIPIITPSSSSAAATTSIAGPTDVVVGKPEDTVLAVLNSYSKGSSMDEFAVERLSEYIKGCQGDDPVREILTLQAVLEESMGFVNKRVDIAYEIGIANMQEQCGEGNLVQPFFESLSTLQDQFVMVSQALGEAHEALACPRINALYVNAVHDALCTDFATANSSGFILFLVFSFCGMILISLRAAWRSAE